MFIDPYPIEFLKDSRGVHCTAVKVMSCSWRGGNGREKAFVIFGKGAYGKRLVYLVDETDSDVQVVEIPFEAIAEKKTPSALTKNLQPLANSWRVNAEDLVDRLLRLAPQDW